MSTTNPLMAQFLGEPALVAPEMSERFQSCLIQAVAHPSFAKAQERADSGDDDYWPSPDDEFGCWLRPYVIKGDILHIPVKGVLLHNFSFAFGSWATGYKYIYEAFKRGCGDFATGTIKGIALVLDTPGGMVAGCFDAVDKMIALKDSVGVPVRAFAHESAYSAGYAIATVADHIVVSRTGGVGSIGVVTSHTDASGALEKSGYAITFIASDPSKVEGNYTEPLSPEAKQRIQARIDELYAIFVAAVSRSRGLDESAIRGDLKAYCFTASQAVSNGLADSIGSLDDAMSAFAGDLDDQSEGDENMTTEKTGSVDQATLDAAVAAAGNTAAATAKTDERTRVGAILGSDEAKGRETLANHIAFNTDMSVDDAKSMLAASAVATPTPAAPAPKDSATAAFDAAMDKDNPEVGAEGGGSSGAGSAADADSAKSVLGIVAAAGLTGFGAAAK